MSTFVLVKTVAALFYLSFLHPGFVVTSASALLAAPRPRSTAILRGNYAISNTKLVSVLSRRRSNSLRSSCTRRISRPCARRKSARSNAISPTSTPFAHVKCSLAVDQSPICKITFRDFEISLWVHANGASDLQCKRAPFRRILVGCVAESFRN